MIRPSTSNASDSYVWNSTQSGSYSTKSGYFKLAKNREEAVERQQVGHSETSFNWIKCIWKRKVSPKLKIFLWKIAQNALPTGHNLSIRGQHQLSKCSRCQRLETLPHLLFECDFAKQVWQQAPFKNPISVRPGELPQEVIAKTQQQTILPPSGIVEADLFAWICWEIWQARNKLIFQQKTISAIESLNSAIRSAREWEEAQRINVPEKRTPQRGGIRAHKKSDRISLFTDAAWKSGEIVTGIGWNLRESNGLEVNSGAATCNFVISPLMAEAEALFRGLKEAKRLGIFRLEVHSDSLQLIQTLNSKEKNKHLHSIISDIVELRGAFEEVDFYHIPRADNVIADSLAKDALNVALLVEQTG